jgi:sulfonate transport system substrate-binding protein
MIKRFTTLVAAVALLGATTAGCGSGSDSASADSGPVDLAKVTLHVGDQKGTGAQALLTAAGLLKDVKYKISWSQFTSGPPILEAINAGSVDIGAVGNAPPVFSAAAGAKIKVVGVDEKGVGGQAIVVPQNSTLKTVADLRGKSVAVAKGSSANFQLLVALKKAGLSFADVKAQYLQPPDALAALSAGKVDAWAIWDPYTAQAQNQLKARILQDGTGLVNGFEFQVASTKALADRGRAAAMRDYVSRLQKAHIWVNAHPADWAATFSKLTGLPVQVTTTTVDRSGYKDLKLDADVIAREQQVADAFQEAGLIPGAVKIDDFVDPRFNDLLP